MVTGGVSCDGWETKSDGEVKGGRPWRVADVGQGQGQGQGPPGSRWARGGRAADGDQLVRRTEEQWAVAGLGS